MAIQSNFKNFLFSFAKRESEGEVLKIVSAYVKPPQSLNEPGKINLEKVSDVFNLTCWLS